MEISVFKGIDHSFVLFFSAALPSIWGLKFPDQGLNPCPLQWKHDVLTTEPPGKSQTYVLSIEEEDQ